MLMTAASSYACCNAFYVVESYGDRKGRTQRRTLCYLGREQDGADTIEKAIRLGE
jgi:hypothetical protein